MSISQSVFDDLFAVVQTVIETHPDTLGLDPLAELNAKSTIRIRYTRKPKLNQSSAFMTIKKAEKNWIGILLEELAAMVLGLHADATILHSAASAKSSVKKSSQTWFQFVTELYEDKIRNRNDISEAQARQLIRLIELMSANGGRLKGCGELSFVDETGQVL